EELAERLDAPLIVLSSSMGAQRRQQSLRATIDWSYALLDPAPQALLRKLSVFSGGWMLPAAEAVGDATTAADLTDLVDHSLVQVGWRNARRPRYRLLDAVRQYA